MPHTVSTHGPTPTTTCSTAIVPWSVCTAVTAPLESDSNPVTRTPSTIRAPASRAFAASPCSEAMLFANPPLCSCRQTWTPWARQSGNRRVM